MPEQRSIDSITGRLKKALRTAQWATSEVEIEQAISALVRIMDRDGKEIIDFAIPTATVIDNREEIIKAYNERNAALDEVKRLKKEGSDITMLRGEVEKLQNHIKALENEVKRRDEMLAALHQNQPALLPISIPLKKFPTDFDIPLIKLQLDSILTRNNLWIKPSAEMAEVLKMPNLQDTMPHLTRTLAVEFSHIVLEQDIFKEILSVFMLKGKLQRKAITVFIALLINMPFDFNEKVHQKLRSDVGSNWPHVRKSKPVEPWAAYAIRCGVLQTNLCRLEGVQPFLLSEY